MARPLQAEVTPIDYYPLVLRTLVAAVVIGAFVGVAGWLITLFLQYYFVEPVFCADSSSTTCANGDIIAWTLAHTLVIGASVVAMVRFGIYRPLLVALAVLATAWGMSDWLGTQEWWSATLWEALIFGLGYGAYAWIARTRQFWSAALLTVLVVVLCRFVLSWA